MQYDPLAAPDPETWNAASEDERLRAVLRYHVGDRDPRPNDRLHAAIHVVVENQAAMGDTYPARAKLARLMMEDVDRHEAIHAIGSVVSDHMFRALKDPRGAGSLGDRYLEDLRKLTIRDWRKKFAQK